MTSQMTPRGLEIATTQDRVALARRTHRSVARTFFILFGALAMVIAVSGALLSLSGRASLIGSLAVAAAFVAFAFLVNAWVRSTERKGERFLDADGATQFIVSPTSLRVGSVEVPLERITCVYATVEGEQYSGGGIRGEAMAARMDIAEGRPTIGRGIGSRVGTAQRRRMYRDGAKSDISLMIGVDRKAGIQAPEGFINPLRTLPRRGDDAGRIDVPFGAYLTEADLEILLGGIWSASGGAFPVGIVSGVMDWASATTSAAESREKINEESVRLLPS